MVLLRHEGDVDLHSGDLRMQGDLTVTGHVRNGFVVRATGNVEVLGRLMAAQWWRVAT